MRVAITGSRGLIGGAVRARLEADGCDVLGLDLRDGFDVRQRFDFGDDVDGVIHLAGVLGTHELFDDVHNAIASNITGTVNVLDAVVRTGRCPAYVGITMPPVFPSIYTATKIAAAAFERAYRHEYRIPMVKVRAFNAFGPGQAHGPGHPQKIVPTFACEAWAGRPIPIWGDGTQGVDLISTSQLADVLYEAYLAANSERERCVAEDVTIDGGSGTCFTVNEVAGMVNDYTGNAAGVKYLSMRRGEIPTNICAEREGWEWLSRPVEFDLAELHATIDSYRDHPMVKR